MAPGRPGVAVVTGAAGGVGRAIAAALVADGWRVALVGRRRAPLEELAAACGPGAAAFPADVTEPADVAGLREAVRAWAGAPGVLVNGAGVFGPLEAVGEVDPAEWIATQRVNLEGTFLTCNAFVPDMVAAGFGRVLNVTSAASLHPPGVLGSAYATSKAGVNQLTRHLAASLAGTGVTANVLHPGDVKTEMWADIRDRAAALGPAGAPFTAWTDWVLATGGDPPEAAARLVLDVVRGDGAVNGAFLWLDDPLQPPIPAWEGAVEERPWEDGADAAPAPPDGAR